MYEYMGRGGISPQFLTIWRSVVRFMPLLNTLRTATGTAGQVTGWYLSQSGRYGQEKNLNTDWNETSAAEPVAVMTELSRLHGILLYF
jgi:hypothetical protein